MWRRIACILAIVVLGVIGGRLVLRDALASRTAAAPLPVLSHVPEFSLVDHTGRQFSDAQLRGRVWVADFIFTHCSGQCPMMHERMRQIAEAIQNPAVQFVSFTVDPERDTPQALAAFVAQQGWSTERWSFVTGSRAELERVCLEGFHLSMGPAEEGTDQLTHSIRLALVDRQGAVRGYYDATDDVQTQQLARDVQRVLESAP